MNEAIRNDPTYKFLVVELTTIASAMKNKNGGLNIQQIISQTYTLLGSAGFIGLARYTTYDPPRLKNELISSLRSISSDYYKWSKSIEPVDKHAYNGVVMALKEFNTKFKNAFGNGIAEIEELRTLN
jgi:hypothetical protein